MTVVYSTNGSWDRPDEYEPRKPRRALHCLCAHMDLPGRCPGPERCPMQEREDEDEEEQND